MTARSKKNMNFHWFLISCQPFKLFFALVFLRPRLKYSYFSTNLRLKCSNDNSKIIEKSISLLTHLDRFYFILLHVNMAKIYSKSLSFGYILKISEFSASIFSLRNKRECYRKELEISLLGTRQQYVRTQAWPEKIRQLDRGPISIIKR